eukprot:Rhum_TRINITY_DN21374_c0_g1::Rhum_TRINITY_DN21374_c0_g1_i1::g.173678::m.173678
MTEAANRISTLGLILATVDGNGLNAFQEKIFVDVVNVRLLLSKDQHGRWCLLQALQQVDQLHVLLHVLHLLPDVEGGSTCPVDVHHHRVHERRSRKLDNLLGHCGREHDRLTLLLEVLVDVAHVFLKAHVDHPVSLVQAHEAAQVEVERVALQTVHQPARRRKASVHAVAEGSIALCTRRTADGGESAQQRQPPLVQRLGVLHVDVEVLHRKLSAGRQRQREGSLASGEGHHALFVHVLDQHGDDKDECLSAAGVRDADDVPVRQAGRDALHLNGLRCENAVEVKSRRQLVRYLEVAEGEARTRHVVSLDQHIVLLPDERHLLFGHPTDVPRRLPRRRKTLPVRHPVRQVVRALQLSAVQNALLDGCLLLLPPLLHGVLNGVDLGHAHLALLLQPLQVHLQQTLPLRRRLEAVGTAGTGAAVVVRLAAPLGAKRGCAACARTQAPLLDTFVGLLPRPLALHVQRNVQVLIVNIVQKIHLERQISRFVFCVVRISRAEPPAQDPSPSPTNEVQIL